jgi:dTDP-4-dehydrorhamnose reductase
MVMGAGGMLGNAILRFFDKDALYEVYGTVRNQQTIEILQPLAPTAKFISDVDIESMDNLARLFTQVKPDVIVNCIGVVKQLAASNEVLYALPINSLLPHRLAVLTEMVKSRLVHLSTDCVFSGSKGNYAEGDLPDAQDLYGRSKLLGEVDYPHAITLRTSIIGHELKSTRSLVNWFLSQPKTVRGYRNAIFSGLPTVEIARLIRDYVIPFPHLHGLYHVSADPISKYDLLCLIRDVYQRHTEIVPEEDYVIDRSLNSERFRHATGFQPERWVEMIRRMHEFG